MAQQLYLDNGKRHLQAAYNSLSGRARTFVEYASFRIIGKRPPTKSHDLRAKSLTLCACCCTYLLEVAFVLGDSDVAITILKVELPPRKHPPR